VAPAGITGPWRVLGPAVLALAKSGTAPSSGSSAVTTQALASVSAIAADAKTRCGLDLTPLIVGVGG
jgi:hypothetical protein